MKTAKLRHLSPLPMAVWLDLMGYRIPNSWQVSGLIMRVRGAGNARLRTDLGGH